MNVEMTEQIQIRDQFFGIPLFHCAIAYSYERQPADTAALFTTPVKTDIAAIATDKRMVPLRNVETDVFHGEMKRERVIHHIQESCRFPC